jgi:hypothetical protein
MLRFPQKSGFSGKINVFIDFITHFLNKEKYKSGFILIYYSFIVLGLSLGFLAIFRLFSQVFFLQFRPSFDVFPWIRDNFLYPPKISELVEFSIWEITLIIFLILLFPKIKKVIDSRIQGNIYVNQFEWVLCGLCLVGGTGLKIFLKKLANHLLFVDLLVVFLLVLPIWIFISYLPFSRAFFSISHKFQKRVQSFILIVLGILFLPGVYYYDHFLNIARIPIIFNQYWDLSEQLCIGDLCIKSSQITNEKGFGPQKFPFSPHKLPCVHLSKESQVKELLQFSSDILKISTYTDQFYKNEVCFFTSLDEISKSKLLKFIYSISATQASILKNAFKELSDKVNKINKSPSDYGDLLMSTGGEAFRNQVAARAFFHHHNFYLAPLVEFSIKKDISHITSQYGAISIKLLYNLISFFYSRVDFNSYFSFMYLFNLTYFILFLVFGFFVFNRKGIYLILFSSVTMMFLLKVPFLHFSSVPGNLGYRHFMDLVVVFSVFRYAVNRKILWLIIGFLASSISSIVHEHFGFLMLIAFFSYALFSNYFYKNKSWKTLCGITFLFLGINLLFLLTIPKGVNPLGSYYLAGMASAPVSRKLSFIFLISSFFALYIFTRKKITTEITSHVGIFTIFYIQGLFLKFHWHPHPTGFFAYGQWYAFALSLVIFVLGKYLDKNKAIKIIFLLIILIISFKYSVSSFSEYWANRHKYFSDISNYRLFEWQFHRLKIATTMDPEPFQEAINQINKFSQKDEVFLISVFDDLLYWLSNKMSGFPFFTLQFYLISPSELQNAVQAINVSKPKHIFVDRTLFYDWRYNVAYTGLSDHGLSWESRLIAQRKALMRSVFESVAEDYELIEQGELLYVFKRTNIHEDK